MGKLIPHLGLLVPRAGGSFRGDGDTWYNGSTTDRLYGVHLQSAITSSCPSSCLSLRPLLSYFKKLDSKPFYFTRMSVLPACTYVCHVTAYCSRRSEEGTGSLGTGVTDGVSHHVGARN